MAGLPTPIKSWRFLVNQTAGSSAGAAADTQDFLYKLVNALVSFGFVVKSSSDGATAGNNDDVNRWTSTSKIVGNYAGVAHSWIVLENDALAGAPKASICIDCNSQPGYVFHYVYFSLTGFGAANGGVDGTTLQRPTAASSAVSWTLIDNYGLNYAGAAGQCTFHIVQSTDRKCTRIFVTDASYRGATALVGYIFLEEVRNPLPTWTTPVFTISCGYNNLYYLDRDHMCTNGYVLAGRYNGATVSLRLDCPYAYSQCVPDNPNVAAADDASAGLPMIPMSLVSVTQGRRHWHLGEVFDMWWGHYTVNTGDTYPNTPSGSLRQFIQLHKTILPWDGLAVADGTPINMS